MSGDAMAEIILHVGAGQGPRECEWVVAQLARVFRREAEAAGLVCIPIEPVEGPVPSLLLRVSGSGAEAFAAARCGSIRWIGTSPFRPLHKRRNWFAGVSRIPPPEAVPDLRDGDIRYQAMRASGPGGQHVNTTDSAVRATHLPTGLATTSQDQRSQHANRRIARLKLQLMFVERQELGAADDKRGQWERNHALERGNAVRSYEGPRFRPVPG
ncbi:MAG: peptide chain release factor H [Sphingomonas sp.]